MTIEVDVHHRLGAFSLDARFATTGRLVALFGRSGSGKTSVIKIIAGLIRPDRGRVVVDGRVLLDTEAGIDVPVHRRRIGYVFQENRLFPHLTVRQNLLYGRWFNRGAARPVAVDDIVDLLGIGHLLGQRPARLSGGEAQRVAIGRALLAAPHLLLMDEPLAALDETRRSEILPYIERLRDETRIPIVYVSHSVAEVARLATTLVIIENGSVEAEGRIEEIMARTDLPSLAGSFEAGAIIDAVVAGHEGGDGLTRLRYAQAPDILVPGADWPVGTPVRLRIRARDVMLAATRPSGLSALNVIAGVVTDLVPVDTAVVDVRLRLSGPAGQYLLARITRRSVAELGLVPGRSIFAVLKAVAVDRRGPDVIY